MYFVMATVGVAVAFCVLQLFTSAFIPNDEMQDFKSTYDTRIMVSLF
jgi:hypothetical protein